MSFYKSKKWLKKRANILRRDEYECQECKRYGKTTPATTVHHIYPLETHPHLRLISDNLISLCNECHNSMHDRNTNAITDVGKRWQERVAPPTFNPYISVSKGPKGGTLSNRAKILEKGVSGFGKEKIINKISSDSRYESARCLQKRISK